MLVRINRSTFKKNPRAGETVSHYSLPMWAEKETRETKDGVVITSQYVSSGKIKQTETGVECSKWVLTRREIITIPFSKHKGTINHPDSFTIHRPVETVHHSPFPVWLYEYENPTVKCNHCGAEFQDSELQTSVDCDDYYDDTVCPKCNKFSCCTMELESPEIVAKELGLSA